MYLCLNRRSNLSHSFFFNILCLIRWIAPFFDKSGLQTWDHTSLLPQICLQWVLNCTISLAQFLNSSNWTNIYQFFEKMYVVFTASLCLRTTEDLNTEYPMYSWAEIALILPDNFSISNSFSNLLKTFFEKSLITRNASPLNC